MAAADCLGDEGYKDGERLRADAVQQAARIRQATAILIAVDNAFRVIDNFKKQRDVADRMLKIAEEQQDHMENVYWPRELQFLEEFANPEEQESIEVMGRRYAGRMVATIADAFAKKERQMRCDRSRYCASDFTRQWQNLQLQKAFGISQARVLGRNIAFAQFRSIYDRDNQRRQQAIMVGKGLMGEAANLMAKAAAGLANAGAVAAQGMNQALAGVGAAFQYRGPSNAEFARDSMRSAQMTQQDQQYAPGYWTGGATGSNQIAGAFGFDSSQAVFTQQDSSNMVFNNQADSLYTDHSAGMFYNRQAEVMNEGNVGNRDRARTGEHTYVFTDSDGDVGQITVKMTDFPLNFVDDKQPGES